MRKHFIISALLISHMAIQAQSVHNQYMGVNLLQIPSLTFNVNYTREFTPTFTSIFELGFTPNYIKAQNIDLVGYLLTPHSKGANEGYDIDVQTGGYIKTGGYVNLRYNLEKTSFFHFGLSICNSVIYESGTSQALIWPTPPIQDVEHTKYIFGLNLAFGYEFTLYRKLRTNIDFQISLPNKKYEDLYGYRNYIPGMGYKDFEGYWFPMLIWNIKYQL
ncbi:MAG: hypothetical protein IPI37_11910 [Bacteroidales bacterium]|jgi:hypothetical protein|nr:hypothetical protein [Bacteroidales bacterium]MBK7733437.1 hypothetical protein [Bacteroidales bacterium]TAH60175.1 MAG: hypothetical protein EWM46_10330 [Fermentimonas caenicola]